MSGEVIAGNFCNPIKITQLLYPGKVAVSDKLLGEHITKNQYIYLIGLHFTEVIALIRRSNVFCVSALFILGTAAKFLLLALLRASHGSGKSVLAVTDWD